MLRRERGRFFAEKGDLWRLLPPLASATASGGAIAVSLLVDRRRWGVLIVEAEDLTPEDLPFIQLFGSQMAHFVERLTLLARREQELSELKATQERLILAEKMAAIGRLTASLAHEIRNPLGAIYNSVDALSRRLRLEERDRRQMDVVLLATERLEALLRDFLSFARPRTLETTRGPLRTVVDRTVELVKSDPRFQSTVEITVTEAAPLPDVSMDPSLMGQALLNLLINAAQAMDGTGRIDIALESDGDGIAIRLSDTGPGIPPEFRHRLFDPFFSTRAGGTGLGLAVVHRIVVDHGGTIEVSSPPGAGATFAIRIPS